MGLIPFALNANSICSLQTDNGKQVTCYVHHPWVNAPVYNKKDTVLLEKPHGHVISSSGINSICTKCNFPPFQTFSRYSTISQGSQAISFHSFEVNSICTEGHFSLLCMEDCVLLKKLEQLHTRNYLALEYEIKSLILSYTTKSCIQNLFKFL